LIAAVVIVLVMPVYLVIEHLSPPGSGVGTEPEAVYVGREKCLSCHPNAYNSWTGSDHDRSMAVATDSTVLGNFGDVTFDHMGITSRFYRRDGGFFVYTEGPGGEMAEFEITHVFGYDPLQQYLIPFPGGRLQCLTIAWDTERGRWFHLYPDRKIPAGDWLHWTRNGQNWNGMCAECHSTNLEKGYDFATRSFNTTYSEINVSCEACHGPGSAHVAWAEIPPMARRPLANMGLVVSTNGLTARQQVELCAPCHSRRTELGDYRHGRIDVLDALVPSVLEDPLYFADGQIEDEVYVYGSFVQSKMFANDVRCSDCHDVHSTRLHASGNELCLQCHRADAYDIYDHHFHKKEVEGRPSDGALCVKCHMPERLYMVVDARADHSIRIPRPDLTQSIGAPNACNQTACHDDQSTAWAAEHYRTWYGIARKPHFGTVLASGRSGDLAARDPLIRLAADALYPPIVRATALSLLGQYPGPESTGAFRLALSDTDALVRYTALGSVSAATMEQFVDLVSPLLFDPVRAVRLLAASRLAGTSDDLLKPYQLDALRANLIAYRKAMEYSLDFSHAGHNLGNLYQSLGDVARAEQYYRAALEVDDLTYAAKVNLAMMLNSQGRNAEAEQLLREVLDSHPDLHEVAYSLGLLMAELGRMEDAAGFLRRATEGMPEHSRAFYNLGLVYQQLGEPGASEAALGSALALEPENPDYLLALADFYINQNRLDEALVIADRMISLDAARDTGRRVRAHIESLMRSRSNSR
jgi:predicted CXXCH cytochrome family protein